MTTPTGLTFQRGHHVSRAKKLQKEIKPGNFNHAMFVSLEHWRAKRSDPKWDEYLQEMRRALVNLLEDHAKVLRGERGGQVLPEAATDYLLEALEDLITGEKHPVLSPHRIPRGKRNLRSKNRRRQITYAIDYLTAVDLGLIDDGASRKHVADSLSVSQRQVYRWLKEAGSLKRREKLFRERWHRKFKVRPEKAGQMAAEVFKTIAKERPKKGSDLSST